MPAAGEPFHHPSGEWREYNSDWLAACPDKIDEDAATYYGYSCFASAGSQELNSAGLPAWKLTLIHNRLTGDVDVAFTGSADDAEVDTRRPLNIEFTGAMPQTFDFTTDLETRFNTTNQWFVANEARRDALIAQMKMRNAITLGVPLTTADEPVRKVRFSLRGVLASLDFMASYARRVSQY
ncbi:hypothetical protein [Devosia sp. LC5]|uniref:hypothetical protein n=1 Tax=Devosia sp. LC5 TaxID=1502724 RepID=UPI000A7CC423|nr:hypothetical protein [Devosia sp. LC5]